MAFFFPVNHTVCSAGFTTTTATPSMTLPESDPADNHSSLAIDWPAQVEFLELYFQPKQPSNKPSVSDVEIIKQLSEAQITTHQTLLDIVRPKLEPEQPIGPRPQALLQFAEQLFQQYITQNQIDLKMVESLNGLRSAIAISLFNKQNPWKESNLLPSLCDTVTKNICGWHPNLGRAGDRFLQQFSNQMLRLGNTPQSIEAGSSELFEFFDRENVRISKLENRLHDAELGQAIATHAKELSARVLNQHMAGKKLPAAVSIFLQGPWRESMRLLLINDGEDSDRWKNMLSLTAILIGSFQPVDYDNAETRNVVYDSISELTDQLNSFTIGLHHSDRLEQELAAIQNEHMKILQSIELNYSPFSLIDNSSPLTNSIISVSNKLVEKASNTAPGQWFRVRNEDMDDNKTASVIRLSSNISDAGQLLFTNACGIKTHQYSYEEFSYLLSSNTIVPFNTKSLTAIAEQTIQSNYTSYQQQLHDISRRESEQKTKEKERQLARVKAREKALREARIIEQEQLAARKKAAQEQAHAQKTAAKEKNQARLSELVNNLCVGGSVSFSKDGEPNQLCRLAAIIQSTGAHIFVDRSGIKQHTLDKDEIMDMAIAGTIKIVDAGSNFDSTLEQVVSGLRTRKTKHKEE